MTWRNVVLAVAAVVVAGTAGLLIFGHDKPAPARGTAAFYRAQLGSEDCGRLYPFALRKKDSAWAEGAMWSGGDVCGGAGPSLQWAHFAGPSAGHAQTAVAAGMTVCTAGHDLAAIPRRDRELTPLVRRICRTVHGTVLAPRRS